MYIVPFYTKTKEGSITNAISLTVAWVFMKEGTIWKTEDTESVDTESVDTIVKEYIEENGMYGKVNCVKGDTLYFEIDTTRTNMDAFYRWLVDDIEDIEIDIWRPYFFIKGSELVSVPEQIKVLRQEVLNI
jgi:hypothetical protein